MTLVTSNLRVKLLFSVFFVSVLTSSSWLFGQNKTSRIFSQIAQEKTNARVEKYNLFNIDKATDETVSQEIENVVYLKLNKNVLSQLLQNKSTLISIELPIGDRSHSFTFLKSNFFDPNFKVYEKDGDGKKTIVNVPKGVFYKGVLDSDRGSVGSLSLFNNEVGAVFSTIEDGNYNLVLNYNNPGNDNENYLLFKEKDIQTENAFSCGSDAISVQHLEDDNQDQERNVFSSCKTLRIALFADYILFQRKALSVANVNNYLTLLFNEMNTLFNEESINAVLSEMVVSTATEGYSYQSSQSVLYGFGEMMHDDTTWNGDIAHLVTGYRQGGYAPLGGIAWLNVLCRTPTYYQMGSNQGAWIGPYSICNNYAPATLPQVPIYSWDVTASIHELGHNIGSEHTHSCSWPGGAIDGCVPVEGNCAQGPIPSNGGTIMSYCHLSSVGVNLANGFGPLPGNLLRSRVASRACVRSSIPEKTVETASVTRVANRECKSGSWTYYYYDNNTADQSDDELLLVLNQIDASIGNIDTTGFEVSMTTTSNYGSNTGRTVNAPYNSASWQEINRTWKVTVPTNLQSKAVMIVRVPFNAQDVSDLQGTTTGLTTSTQLKPYVFRNGAAANNPNAANVNDIKIYNNGTASTDSTWVLGSNSSYNYAEFRISNGIFGGSISYTNDETTGINNRSGATHILSIYPNPASKQVNINIPSSLNKGTDALVVEVYDNLGRLVIKNTSKTTVNGEASIEVSSLTAGTYFVRLVSGDATFQGRFTKD